MMSRNGVSLDIIETALTLARPVQRHAFRLCTVVAVLLSSVRCMILYSDLTRHDFEAPGLKRET